MSRFLRTFIAIELDPAVKKALHAIQKDLKKTGADAKWVDTQNMHLTLKFLKETPEEKVPLIIKAMEKNVVGSLGFPLKLTHLGAFPKIHNPRVVWVGFKEGKEETKRIAAVLEDELAKIGFPKEEREFDPHITLGRVRSSLNKFALTKALKDYAFPQGLQQTVSHLAFVKSTLTPTGPVYEVLATV